MSQNILDVIDKVQQRDHSRFANEAYFFVSEALAETVSKLGRDKKPAQQRHVSGMELSEGVADYALDTFGPMTYQVLTTWGIFSTRDIGDIVYSLIDAKMMSKSDSDSIEDFNEVYDFKERFLVPWQ